MRSVILFIAIIILSVACIFAGVTISAFSEYKAKLLSRETLLKLFIAFIILAIIGFGNLIAYIFW